MVAQDRFGQSPPTVFSLSLVTSGSGLHVAENEQIA
jgi:hypothetical protein